VRQRRQRHFHSRQTFGYKTVINNRIQNTFQNLKKNKKKALITFITGCDPNYETSKKILNELVKQGADLLEIGMPFSDPMADGPSIQKSSLRALSGGTNIKKIIRLVSDFRKKNKVTPVILMGYLNPILSFGINNFFKSAKKAGTDGLIVVDVPSEEDNEIFSKAKENNIDLIKLATPTTDTERLKKIIKTCSGFLYYVSIKGITGAKSGDPKLVKKSISNIKKNTNLPVAVGFGIKNPSDAKVIANTGCDGIVVGSALVEIIEKSLKSKKPKHNIALKIGSVLKRLKMKI